MENRYLQYTGSHWVGHFSMITLEIKWYTFIVSFIKENNSTIGCRITAIEPDQFLSFEWRSPKQFKHFANQADPLTHVVVLFVPRGESTHVHLIHSGWRGTPEWEEARRWQGQAWSVAFERLEKLVNGESA